MNRLIWLERANVALVIFLGVAAMLLFAAATIWFLVLGYWFLLLVAIPAVGLMGILTYCVIDVARMDSA
jgi:hypothetical protein